MLISCPNCSSTFAVPAKALGENGKKVKCSKCGHMWHQNPPPAEKSSLDNLLNVNKSEDKNLPVKTNKTNNLGYIAACLILVFICVILQFMAMPKLNENISQMLGLEDFTAIKMVNFTSESQINDNKWDIKISGVITNTSSREVKTPTLDVKILSKGGRVIAEDKIKIEKEKLEPYEIYNFSTEINRVTGNAEILDITFGNWLEKMFF